MNDLTRGLSTGPDHQKSRDSRDANEVKWREEK